MKELRQIFHILPASLINNFSEHELHRVEAIAYIISIDCSHETIRFNNFVLNKGN